MSIRALQFGCGPWLDTLSRHHPPAIAAALAFTEDTMRKVFMFPLALLTACGGAQLVSVDRERGGTARL